MSLPRQVPPSSNSSSPSKSSLGRSGGNQNPPTQRSLLPSPQFKEPRFQEISIQRNEYEYDGAHTGTSPSQHVPLLPPPPNFQPFFALVQDTVTHEHFHPTVHYIFADDDSDIITEAACRSLERDQEQERDGGSQAVVSGGESIYLPRPAAGVKEHYVLLDVQPTSVSKDVAGGPSTMFEVTGASSMSSEWQVLRTNVTNAPTIGDGEGDEGLMLKIEGRGNTPPDVDHRLEGGKVGKESVEEMIESFQKRLDDVRMVMLASAGHARTGMEDDE